MSNEQSSQGGCGSCEEANPQLMCTVVFVWQLFLSRCIARLIGVSGMLFGVFNNLEASTVIIEAECRLLPNRYKYVGRMAKPTWQRFITPRYWVKSVARGFSAASPTEHCPEAD